MAGHKLPGLDRFARTAIGSPSLPHSIRGGQATVKRRLVFPAAIAMLAAAAALIGLSGAAFSAPLTKATATAGHSGGTLKLLYQGAFGSWDPQIDYTLEGWQLEQATQDGLLNFKHAQGTAAYTVVPDLATAIPKPTDGGRTWVFHIRKGIKFSNGAEVKPSDFLYTFQRIFKVHGPTASSFYGVLVGASACLKNAATCTLKGGVIADDKNWTVTFHLTSPDGEWLQKLAVPLASVVPSGTPNKDQGPKPIPSTGAYVMKSYDPNHQITLVRNPYFKQWSKDAQPAGYPDTITERFDLTGEAEVTEVENGQADWIGYAIPSDRLNELATKYAKQLHLNQLTAIWYAPMNVNIPPFNNIDARRAVNYALDRSAVIRLFGGPNLASPTCQILPPGFPGHQDYCPYSKNPGTKWTAPDMAKALQLAKASGTQGQKVAVVAQNTAVDTAVGTYLTSLLNKLGWKASLKVLSSNIQFTYIQNTKNHVQISVSQWYQDYPGAADFLNVLFGCGSFHPGSDTSINISGFCDKAIQKQMNTAIALTAVNQTAGNKLWAKVDREVTDASPAATLFNPKNVDFTSKRVGNFVFSDQYYFLVDQAWVQ
jgi:peptide/nickel transport system substrate-binding protein